MYDSEFAYNENATVLKYQSKRRKSVILLSSKHDTRIVDPYQNPKKKPEMVLFYNSTKGAVDTLDKMVHAYTVKRKTQRWPLVMFFNIFDMATIASRSIWTIRFPDHPLSNKDGRSSFIQSISEQLMCAQIKRRMTEVVMPRSLLELAGKAIKHLDCDKATKSQRRKSSQSKMAHQAEAGQKRTASSQGASTSGSVKSKKRCPFCSWRADRKTQQRCNQCDEFICPDHPHKVCPVCIKEIATNQ